MINPEKRPNGWFPVDPDFRDDHDVSHRLEVIRCFDEDGPTYGRVFCRDCDYHGMVDFRCSMAETIKMDWWVRTNGVWEETEIKPKKSD